MALPGQVPDFIFQGGQMTDLPLYELDLAGDELFELVAPGNAETGLNYRYTAAQLIAAVAGGTTRAVVVKTGATVLDPFTPPFFPPRFLIKKDVPSATFVTLDLSATYPSPILIRDIAGNADVYPIQVTFSGGELADGLATVTINTPYGGYFFNPLPSTEPGGFYIGTA